MKVKRFGPHKMAEKGIVKRSGKRMRGRKGNRK
jgi:hypothetical protein